jgi:hypothetical protein
MAWWKKALLTLGLFVVWLIGLIVIGGQGYPSQYFWISGGAAAIAFAVALFWKLRTSVWYWPTIAVLAVANLAGMYFARVPVGHRDLPAKGLVQLLFVADCMISWGTMVCACWLCCRLFPWQLLNQRDDTGSLS